MERHLILLACFALSCVPPTAAADPIIVDCEVGHGCETCGPPGGPCQPCGSSTPACQCQSDPNCIAGLQLGMSAGLVNFCVGTKSGIPPVFADPANGCRNPTGILGGVKGVEIRYNVSDIVRP